MPNSIFIKVLFTGAVFAHQTQHLALFRGEVDVCEHLIAEKALFDIPHLKQRSIVLSIFIPTYSSEEGGCPPPRFNGCFKSLSSADGEVLFRISTSALPMKWPGSPMI